MSAVSSEIIIGALERELRLVRSAMARSRAKAGSGSVTGLGPVRAKFMALVDAQTKMQEKEKVLIDEIRLYKNRADIQ